MVLVASDGSVDRKGNPTMKGHSGGWKIANLLLVNQGLATLAFFGVSVNLVLFLTRVLEQDSAEAANNVSKWTGTVYLFSLVGAFLSDSYWGRYLTCAIFQLILVVGLVLLSISSGLFLIKPVGCGDGELLCVHPSPVGVAIFYLSIYLIAFGYGGYQPTIATFGADQFNELDPNEKQSKAIFFGYFYFALNFGSLFSNTILVYFEDSGQWTLGFLASMGSAIIGLLLFLLGTPSYRYFKPCGNPLKRVAQVFVATARKWNVIVPSNGDKLYELEGSESAIKGSRKILHSDEFGFLDKAATVTEKDLCGQNRINPWRLCTVSQVEEVKCVLKMLPIWLCTIIYSVVFTQMASLFVEQGEVMDTCTGSFNLPAASMSAFDIVSVLIFTGIYRRFLVPITGRFTRNPKGLTELQRMGIGLIIGLLAMVAAAVTEIERLKRVTLVTDSSSLSIFWQIPQYTLVGASEVFMYVGQLEFFNSQAPDGIKSFGSSLCMASISLGNYVSSLLVNVVMRITTTHDRSGWIPDNLNLGHMDRFYFLIAILTAIDFVIYLFLAKWYKSINLDMEGDEEKGKTTRAVSVLLRSHTFVICVKPKIIPFCRLFVRMFSSLFRSFFPKIRCVNGTVPDRILKVPNLIPDGSVDRNGHPAMEGHSGGWKIVNLILGKNCLATLAFFGVSVNLVLFLTRVLDQDNVEAANNISKWLGSVYLFSLVGAFLSDSYWGRYLTCAIFQLIFVLGLILLSISSWLFLIKPVGCGDGELLCVSPSSVGVAIFYVSIYLIAFGYGGYQPAIATFGADQFNELDPKEKQSKAVFFGCFYFALNFGSLFSNTILVYFEDSGHWTFGFLASMGSAIIGLLLFLLGTPYYRYFKPCGNPLKRVAQVFVATARKWNVIVPLNGEELYELEGSESAIKGSRKILHSDEFGFLDKAAIATEKDLCQQNKINPWRLCTVSQVEEVKCVLKLLPIWLCTIIYYVVYTQMDSLFIEQGAVMDTVMDTVTGSFNLPAASMAAFNIVSVLIFTGIYHRFLVPIIGRFTGNPKGITELQRMGIGLIIGLLAMVAAAITEIERLKRVIPESDSSSLSIFWQIPQYALLGASEVFMYVGQLDFFNSQAPDGIKSFGSALCMASISLGNYVSSLLVNIVMKITTTHDRSGWIPDNLNSGHMDRFYFLIAILTTIDFVIYLFCSKWYKSINLEKDDNEVKGVELKEQVGDNNILERV
ncbi:Proton-dependent oligopeptide transporter family [Macleaya cordata]|uniref:Proton-dependent oligopeptide transporter family n=1 Tax=Macleaya cordata TaxID=56857 RepID=A0A200RDR6_MACCD|nr:Proton-dependent oligopeptide transporter family [Macleaya cordata]